MPDYDAIIIGTIGYGSSPPQCGPSLSRDTDGQTRDLPASDAIPLHVMWPSDPGRATAPRIAVPHMLPSSTLGPCDV
jgi:hypothetical protein